jgi:hypothetical protein
MRRLTSRMYFSIIFFNLIFNSSLLDSAKSKRCAHFCWVQVAVHQQFYNVVGVFLITNNGSSKEDLWLLLELVTSSIPLLANIGTASTYSTKKRKTKREDMIMQLNLCYLMGRALRESERRYSTSGLSRFSFPLAPEYPKFYENSQRYLQLCVYRQRQQHQR